jgi:predicted RNA-binding Zn ribbon-like protein
VDFSHYTDEPVRLAIDLVNTLDVVGGEDLIDSADGLASFLSEVDADLAVPAWAPTEADAAAVRELRDRLRGAFDAEDDAAAASALNEILVTAHATPRVSVHDDVAPHLHFEPLTSDPASWLGAVTAMGLAIVLVDEGGGRFGSCGSGSCADVFIDTSRNRSRRYCSDTCASRENVAAFRRRARD